MSNNNIPREFREQFENNQRLVAIVITNDEETIPVYTSRQLAGVRKSERLMGSGIKEIYYSTGRTESEINRQFGIRTEEER